MGKDGAIDHGVGFIGGAEVAVGMVSDHPEVFELGVEAVTGLIGDDKDEARPKGVGLFRGDTVTVSTDHHADAVGGVGVL